MCELMCTEAGICLFLSYNTRVTKGDFMTIAFIILWVLDLFSELIILTYQTGRLTRQYLVPALVFTYVCGERAWTAVTPTFDWYVHHTPLPLEC